MRGMKVALPILLASAVASAQPSDNKTLADQLFKEGRDLAKANNWTAACPKFEASLRYDPALGTRLNLATCYEKVGKIASAWGVYRDAAEVAAKAGDTKRRDYAAAQATALEKRLPKLTITIDAKAPSGVVVTRDGNTVDPGAYGSALYVDPGEHTIVASADGFESFTTKVTSTEGAGASVAIPELVKKPEVVKQPDQPDKPQPDQPEPPAPVSSGGGKRKLIGLGVAGGGVVLAGVGLTFGVLARSKFNDAKKLCGADLACDSDSDYMTGRQLISDSRSLALRSTILVAVGGAAVVTGAVIWLTAPSGKAEVSAHLTPVVTDRSVAFVLGGQF